MKAAVGSVCNTRHRVIDCVSPGIPFGPTTEMSHPYSQVCFTSSSFYLVGQVQSVLSLQRIHLVAYLPQ